MSQDSLMAAVAQAAGADEAKPVVVTAELIKTHFPSVAADLMAAGRAEGAKAERDRVAGIEAALIKGHEKIIAEMKADPAKDSKARRNGRLNMHRRKTCRRNSSPRPPMSRS